MSVGHLRRPRADVLLLKGVARTHFLASQMQCPSRIDRAITRLRFAKSFIANTAKNRRDSFGSVLP